MMQTAPEDHKARIAAEVAARYGVQVQPDAVQIVPRGASSFPGYVFEGNQLVPIVKLPKGEAIREKISASWREKARQKRVAKAKADEERAKAPKPPRAKVQIDNSAWHQSLKAKAKARADEIRAMADGGADLVEIAAHMAISVDSARKYCQHYGIKAAPRKVINRAKVQKQAAERLAAYMAFAGGGEKTVRDFAEHFGVTWNSASKFIQARGIPHSKADRVAAARVGGLAKAAKAAEVAARKAERKQTLEERRAPRRAAVRELYCAGIGIKEIARRLDCSKQVVAKDAKAMGLTRAEFPQDGKGRERSRKHQQYLQEIDARREQVAKMCADGMTVAAIALKLGASYQAIQRDRMALGIRAPVTPSGHVGNPQLVARVAAMRARKMSLREIAVALSMARSTAHRLVKALEAA